MKVLLIGLNYAPEPVGIGPYSAGTAQFLAEAGHDVTVISGKAYYPQWRVIDDHREGGALASREHGVTIIRLPIYVPARPSGLKRLIHHASFALRALPTALKQGFQARPDVVVCVAPSLISAVVARAVARLYKARYWLHIQDFEVEAAFATGLLRPTGLLAKLAHRFERWNLGGSRVSSISPQMCAKVRSYGVPSERVYEFRNWAEIDTIRPLTRTSSYRQHFGIKTDHVALYSGNIGNKQGIEILIDVARALQHRRDLTFVIAGDGALLKDLVEAARGLDNVRFEPLQPREQLSELLGLATVHLLPQLAGAADLVLPSKLTNMLASGRPVVATAASGTGLAEEVEGCGLVTEPGDVDAMAAAIVDLLDDPAARDRYGVAARKRAEERWSRRAILAAFEAELRSIASEKASAWQREPRFAS
ncbi:putative colanic acid biosynthesis glycosyl transferase WcaI [Novosphingobium nitrogenifigens DSM 19370]|uniref:Putative colanic acid biosynthesis glycosyl transferase WcaI n=1 Tax=Novosphingobium nitrogenifigens DSM 19370 TaxID=983920 RepID=F1ZDU6_9SPHN|nr:WcaI family glycosyltransferase [Novosphingobium nitrogenifigens]EGD57217.1 putative colanic acid biosynthesis glycosyl transferase WcaI [Novosphingobium nitrogenifigens DSM 19370]